MVCVREVTVGLLFQVLHLGIEEKVLERVGC